MTTKEWLRRHFEGVPGRMTIYWFNGHRWISSHRSTTRFDRTERYINERARSSDLYVCPATRVDDLGLYRRGGLNDVVALVALFADIDVEGPSHKLTGYPSEEEALRLLDLIPPVSSLIHTGGGYHACWNLQAPFVVGVDGSAADLRDIVVRFTGGLRELSGKRFDPHEPTKGVRLPGTLNHKIDPPAPVVLTRKTSASYAVEELLSAVPDTKRVNLLPGKTKAQDDGRPRPYQRWLPQRTSRGVLERLAEIPGLVEWILFDRLGLRFLRNAADGARYLVHEDHQSQVLGTPAATWGPYGVPVLVIHSESTADYLGLPSGAGQKLTLGRLWAHLDFGGDVGALVRYLTANGSGSS
jgi:hypothetical protein